MAVSTVVERRPRCDMPECSAEAHFDAKTIHGPWAYLCLGHYKQLGIKLGTGFGQRLYLREEVE